MSKHLTLFGMFFFIILMACLPVAVFPATSREIYAAGRKYMYEEKWQQALEIIKPLEKDYPLLVDYVLWDMATCYEKSGDREAALDTLRKVALNYKNSPLYRKAFSRILELEKNSEVTSLIADFNLYLKEFPQDSKALWEKTNLLEKSGRNDEALALRKEIFFTGGPYTLKAYEALKKANNQPSYEDLKKALTRLLEKENYDQVVSLLEGFTIMDDEGNHLLARAYYRLRLYRPAIKTLTGISSREGKSLLAMCLLRTNEKEPFYKLIDELAKEGARDLFSLHMIAAEQRRREGNFPAARTILQSMLGLYPEKKEEISWSQAWLAIRQKKFDEADKILTNLVSDNAKERDKYLFWLGKIKNYQGRSGDAFFSQIKDKSSYYWFRTGKKANPGLMAGDGKNPETLTPLPPETEHYFLRVSELDSLKMRTEARMEARLIAGPLKDQYIPAFVRLLATIEDYPTMVRLGTRHNDLSLAYPLAFRDRVIKSAQEHKLDPLLIMAVMREESRFQNDAISSAGALGVMQLMPATARKMGLIKNNEELFDVGKNIALGAKYLSRLLVQFKVTANAIAAYNAGEHNVEKWLNADYQDEEEFTEDIPFGETKKYVFTVTKTYGVMKSLYGNEVKD